MRVYPLSLFEMVWARLLDLLKLIIGGGDVKTISIDKKTISNEITNPPFLIAEAGVNHEGDINKALGLIEKAAMLVQTQ